MSDGFKIDYGKKKYLVIDDFSEMRHSVKKMLQSFGAKDIDDTGDGDTAVEKISMKSYDIILCDYNLGEGKRDGQQILEEVKHRELIRYSTVYLMITAENTMSMVMGALEYKPDDYMTKPFTKDVLETRLNRVIERKADFDAIEKAINRKEYMAAIQLCTDRIKQKPKNVLEFLRIRADLCIKIGDYLAAKSVYEEVLSIRQIPWATLGLGKVLYKMGNFIEAKNILSELVEDNRAMVEAYDWLAKTLEELGDLKGAQTTLDRAIKLSPKAILRQKALAEVALKNNDLSGAEQSFKEAVKLGKTSCFKSPSDYTGLAKVLSQKDNPEAALIVLKEVKGEFANNDEANLQASVVEGSVYKQMGDETNAKKSVETASKLYSNLKGRVSSEISMDMAKALFDIGDKDKASSIMKEVVRNHHDDEKILGKAQDIFKEANLGDEGAAMISDTKKEIVQINNDGVRLVKDGKLKDAIEFFEKAANGLPENKIVNANAAQALLMFMKESGKNDRHLVMTKKYLDRIRDVDPSYEKYRKLLIMYEKISSGQ
jgi:tetratricopeptide (TPR) repeat protein